MNTETHPYFVPDSLEGSRRETAVLLSGSAAEFSQDVERDSMGTPVDGSEPISQHDIQSVQGGFRITEALYERIWGDDEDGAEGVTTATPETRMEPGTDVPEGSATGEEPTEEEDDEPEDYSTWERNDLLAEVSRRGLETEDKKTATLAAALAADDEDVDSDDETPA